MCMHVVPCFDLIMGFSCSKCCAFFGLDSTNATSTTTSSKIRLTPTYKPAALPSDPQKHLNIQYIISLNTIARILTNIFHRLCLHQPMGFCFHEQTKTASKCLLVQTNNSLTGSHSIGPRIVAQFHVANTKMNIDTRDRFMHNFVGCHAKSPTLKLKISATFFHTANGSKSERVADQNGTILLMFADLFAIKTHSRLCLMHEINGV